MKTIFNYTVLFLLSLSLGCNETPSEHTTAVVLIIDRTDPLPIYPDAEIISMQLGLRQNLWQGITITVTYITDTDINDTKVITLEKESRWTGNTTLRKARIAHFINELHKALTHTSDNKPLGHSIIYRSIAKQLNVLAATEADKKYLLVYSDLMENDELNFYDPKTIALLKNNTDRIRHRLERTMPIGAISSIQVWLLYEPASYEPNNTYMVIAGFYKQSLESKGATVHIEKSFNP